MMNREKLHEAVKPIARGLFGKQGTPRYERPHFLIRPLEQMLRDLTAIPDEEWFGYVFSREPLNGKFKDDQRRRWIRESIACGREYAVRVSREYNASDPKVLAGILGMEVDYPTYPERADRVLFAEYRAPNKIHIYMDAVNRAEKLREEPAVQELLTSQLDIARLLLSHELFHFVEEKYRKEIYTKTEKVRLWSLGPLHNDSGIIALSEIAAMAFAQTLTGLPYSPYVMDMFLVYGYSPEEASGLYEEMMEYAGRTPWTGEDTQEQGKGTIANETEQQEA